MGDSSSVAIDGSPGAGQKKFSGGPDGSHPIEDGKTAGCSVIWVLVVLALAFAYLAWLSGGCCGKWAGEWEAKRLVKSAQKDVDRQWNAFQIKFEREEQVRQEELDHLTKIENKLRPWAEAVRAGEDYEEPGESEFAAARTRFDVWVRQERQKDWDAVVHARKVAQAVDKHLAELERRAQKKGTDVRDEANWADLLARKSNAEKSARELQKKLEDEFVVAAANRYVKRARSLMCGDTKREGLESRIARLREDVSNLRAELERRLDTVSDGH